MDLPAAVSIHIPPKHKGIYMQLEMHEKGFLNQVEIVTRQFAKGRTLRRSEAGYIAAAVRERVWETLLATGATEHGNRRVK